MLNSRNLAQNRSGQEAGLWVAHGRIQEGGLSLKFLILLLISLAHFPPSHSANSTIRCLIEPKSVKRALKHSAAVFSGEVIDIKKGPNFFEARFHVERSWKGVESEDVSVLELNSTAESPHYRVGARYLVFADTEYGKLFTGNCSRTKKIEYAQGDLLQLGVGRVWGHLDVKRVTTPLDLTNTSDSKWQQHLGETVTLRGRFSLNGKVGPFIIVAARPIYLKPHGSFSWGEPYKRLEGQHVRVTGTLRFAKYPKPSHQDLHEGHPSDHFFFEAETAKVELSDQ